MFCELKKAVLTVGLEFRPEFILIDFEYAAIQAFMFCFPRARVLGCWFHFGQCLFRKLFRKQSDQQFDDLEKLLNTVKRLVKVKRYYSYITNKNKIILFMI